MASLGLEIDGNLLGNSRLSAVDGPGGRLSYCGYDLHELALHATWEEVTYLLWHNKLPTEAQLADLKQQLAAERALTPAELAILRTVPLTGHGMDALRTLVSALGQLRSSEAAGLMRSETLLTEGLRLTAKLPTLLTTWIRLRNGQKPIEPEPMLSQAANFLLTLHGSPPDEIATQVLDTYMVVLAENGLNISTFVACVVTSTQNDLFSAITAAIATLKGLAHGGANEHAMRTFLAIAKPENAAAQIAAMVERKERLMGVGHRVFEVEDPRLRHMRRLSGMLAARPGTDSTSHALADAVAKAVQEHPFFQTRGIYPNVEFYSAPLLYQLGLPVDCFTAAFACARMPGWIAHIHEQLANKRLVRPEATYVGEEKRPFVPLAERI